MSNSLEDIKNAVDIVDVVQEYVDLTKKGRNYWGVCPFHNDSNPSMSVSQEKQMFKCFSCNAGGGVFNFVQDIEKISFPEAMKKIGSKVGIEVKVASSAPRYNVTQQQVVKALNDAMDFYQLMIETDEGEKALEYCDSRGLDQITREKFRIGYAPMDKLVDYLVNKKGYDEATLINASLMNSFNKDFFKNRLIFGITNNFGDIIGLSGRTLTNEDSKYINSAQSVVFTKSKILYNYKNAKDAIRKAGNVIVVEGFMDVIALSKAGIDNVVAIMGTALTRENINFLKGIDVTLMFDSDNAGIRATVKSIKELQGLNKVFVINNEGGKDPDEIFNKLGKAGIEQLIENKIGALEFIYEIHKKKFPPTSPDNIQQLIDSFRKYLAKATEIEKQYYSNDIEKNYGISKDIILKGMTPTKVYIKPVSKTYANPRPKYLPKQTPTPKRVMETADFNKPTFTLIRSLMASKQLSDHFMSHRNEVKFIDGLRPDIIINLISDFHNGKKDKLIEYLPAMKEIMDDSTEQVDSENGIDELINIINNNTKAHIKKENKIKLGNKE
ncbi:MAG: DNA primase [Mycoplasmataceae bacterium]|nr:DNA primase [Mycoplasmataceae bacterium]